MTESPAGGVSGHRATCQWLPVEVVRLLGWIPRETSEGWRWRKLMLPTVQEGRERYSHNVTQKRTWTRWRAKGVTFSRSFAVAREA